MADAKHMEEMAKLHAENMQQRARFRDAIDAVAKATAERAIISARVDELKAEKIKAEEQPTSEPYTEEEMEEIRARARGEFDITTAQERLCVDYWSDDLKPKKHQLRPGALTVRGAACAFDCRYVLAEPFDYTAQRNAEHFAKWATMTLAHKEQCLACRKGTSIL